MTVTIGREVLQRLQTGSEDNEKDNDVKEAARIAQPQQEARSGKGRKALEAGILRQMRPQPKRRQRGKGDKRDSYPCRDDESFVNHPQTVNRIPPGPKLYRLHVRQVPVLA